MGWCSAGAVVPLSWLPDQDISADGPGLPLLRPLLRHPSPSTVRLSLGTPLANTSPCLSRRAIPAANRCAPTPAPPGPSTPPEHRTTANLEPQRLRG